MKLLWCTVCNDVVKFGRRTEWRKCRCGKAAARYKADGHCAEIWGTGQAIGMSNPSLRQGVYELMIGDHSGEFGPEVRCWLFPANYFRVERVIRIEEQS